MMVRRTFEGHLRTSSTCRSRESSNCSGSSAPSFAVRRGVVGNTTTGFREYHDDGGLEAGFIYIKPNYNLILHNNGVGRVCEIRESTDL